MSEHQISYDSKLFLSLGDEITTINRESGITFAVTDSVLLDLIYKENELSKMMRSEIDEGRYACCYFGSEKPYQQIEIIEEFKNSDGRLHREDGPAITLSNGTECWFLNGILHRDGGPATKYSSGKEEWFENGFFHREDGPARITDARQSWFLSGKLLKERRIWKEAWEDVYFNDKKQKHRVDGPAVIHSDGRQEWWQNDEIHRVDGPAIIWSDGSENWCINNKLHRTDGPAIIRPYGYEEWRIDGLLHRENGAAIICENWQEWCLFGKRHREDGPALIRKDGSQEWYLDGKRHREDGSSYHKTGWISRVVS